MDIHANIYVSWLEVNIIRRKSINCATHSRTRYDDIRKANFSECNQRFALHFDFIKLACIVFSNNATNRKCASLYIHIDVCNGCTVFLCFKNPHPTSLCVHHLHIYSTLYMCCSSPFIHFIRFHCSSFSLKPSSCINWMGIL